ncbi:MAG: heavy metal translocating P-type ATPase [Pseudomonadota bacterium]
MKRKKATYLSSVLQQTTEKENQQSPFNGKKLVHDLKNVILGDERLQLQLSLDPDMQADIERRKKEEKRNLVLSSGAMGLTLLGTVSPPFYLLGSAGVLYLGRSMFQSLLRDFKQKRFFTVYLSAAVLAIGMIATRQLILAGIWGIMTSFMLKLIKKTEDNSQKNLINVFSGHTDHIWLEKDGVEIQVAFETVQKDDVIIVHAGEIIPVDGIIQRGSASIDQHILTGESQPVERGVGDTVFAATLMLAGRISILVKIAGEETVAANLGNVLNNTKSYKEHLMLRGKKIADSLLPFELGAAVMALGLLGPIPAMAVLWSGMGYNMIMYGPISVLSYLQILSRQGILVKDGRVLESLCQVDTVVFDKTGTLTLEQPSIGAIHLLAHYDENQLLRYAASAEYRQSHPVAKAIIDKAQEQGITLSTPEETSFELGYGIKVQLEQKSVRVGSARFMQREGLTLPEQLDELQQQAEEQGHSLIYVGIDNTIAGILEMQPSIRPEAHQLVKNLQQRGLTTYIISGDHEQPTRNIAKQLGIDHYFAETLPEHKADLINQLRDEGKFVCFIGDGINDAIALKSAQISISLKGASSAATDTAQIIFMDGTLAALDRLFQFTDEFEHTMQKNLRLSIVPGAVNIGGVYLLHFSIAASMGIFYMGTIAGLSNTMLPLIRHQDAAVQKPEKSNDQDRNSVVKY